MSGPKVVIVIPARFGSTRYPGKPLAQLTGATGVRKSLIQRSWEAAMRVAGVTAVHIATDSTQIRSAAEEFGASVVMTSPHCANGTERCAEVASQLGEDADVIVNLQGDAPVTPAYFVEALIARMATPGTEMVTPVVRCSPELYEKLVADEQNGTVGGTTAVFAADGKALYFSKRLIPHFDRSQQLESPPVFLHLGVYAYTLGALRRYKAADPSRLEVLEGLEQLRFMEIGVPVHVVEVSAPAWEMWELNNPSDVPHIENSLRVMGLP